MLSYNWTLGREGTNYNYELLQVKGVIPVEQKKFATYNPGQNSWDTNAIARQIDISSFPPSPRSSVDVMHSSFNSTQSTQLGGEEEGRGGGGGKQK